MKKYQSFLSETFQFLEVKFSVYLNRCVFVMLKDSDGIRWTARPIPNSKMISILREVF